MGILVGLRGELGALKLSSGAPAALPAHPSWPASPQIDSSALLIRSLVTVGGYVYLCVRANVYGQTGGLCCSCVFGFLVVCLKCLYFNASILYLTLEMFAN